MPTDEDLEDLYRLRCSEFGLSYQKGMTDEERAWRDRQQEKDEYFKEEKKRIAKMLKGMTEAEKQAYWKREQELNDKDDLPF